MVWIAQFDSKTCMFFNSKTDRNYPNATLCIFPQVGALPTTELTLHPKLTLFYPTHYIMLLLNIWPIFWGKYKNKHFHTVKNLPCKQVCNSFLTRMFVESLYDFSVYIELKEISFFSFSLFWLGYFGWWSWLGAKK